MKKNYMVENYFSKLNLLITIALLHILFFNSSTFAQDPNFHIYLLFGQSNMEGMGTIESQDRTTNSRVKVLQDQDCSNLNRYYGRWYTAAPPLNRCWSKLGPGNTFGNAMAEAMPSTVTIGLFPTAYSGCDIAFFQKSAPLGKAFSKTGVAADIPSQFTGGYAWMLDMAKKAQKEGVIKGIIFHQGETNTNDPNWKVKVQEVVADLKKDLGLSDIPFLAGELLYKEYKSCCSSHNVEINKLPGLIKNSYVISASGLPGADEAHFTSASYRILGKRYAEKMLTLVKGAECATTVLTPGVRINGGEWQQILNVDFLPEDKITLGPQPSIGGAWAWTGCGTLGTAREQAITALNDCQATATYTNECGSKSVLTFTLKKK